MPRLLCASGVLLVFAAASLGLPPALRQDKAPSPGLPSVSQQDKAPNPIIQLARKLNERVDLDGFADGRTTMLEVLELLRKKYQLAIQVNESAFEAEGIEDVVNFGIDTKKPILKMSGVKLETALKKVLSRIPTQSGTTYVLREDGVEITTNAFKHAEFYRSPPSDEEGLPIPGTMGGGLGALGGGLGALGGGLGALGGGLGALGGGLGALGGGTGGLGALGVGGSGMTGVGQVPATRRRLVLPLVQAEFDKCPLGDALKELAKSSERNIVLSANVADKAKLPVTASFINVPLDSAVLILADMAELRLVLVDKVLYVTTRENAAKLQPEVDHRQGKLEGSDGGPTGPPVPGAPGMD